MFRIFYDRVIGYIADQKIRRETDRTWQNNFQGLYEFCPDGDEDRWCRQFLQISRDPSKINTIISEWSLNGDKKRTVEQSLKKSPYHLAISLEHYCEKATEQVYRNFLIFQYQKELMENGRLDQQTDTKRAELQANKELERQRIKAPVGLFKQVLLRTNQRSQDPSEETFLFADIESIHQCTVFAKFDLERKNSLKDWAISYLHKRTADEIIRNYDPERRNNPWRGLYRFCGEFFKRSPEERQSKLKTLNIPDHSVKYYTELILVFAQMYVPEQETRNGRPQPRYRDPNNKQLQHIADEFNRRLSLRKDAQEMKDELLDLYLRFSKTTPPDWKITSLAHTPENDDGSESTKDVPDSRIPPSPEATEIKELLRNFINQLDNTPERPYQVLLLLEYGFQDKLFTSEDWEDNVQLNQTKIGIILNGENSRNWVTVQKRQALTRLIRLIGEISFGRKLNLEAIAKIKNLLDKELLPDYYFELIRSWIVGDLVKIPIPERNSDRLNSFKVKVKEEITMEIENVGFQPSPEGLALLDPPISRLVEVYAKVTPEQP